MKPYIHRYPQIGLIKLVICIIGLLGLYFACRSIHELPEWGGKQPVLDTAEWLQGGHIEQIKK